MIRLRRKPLPDTELRVQVRALEAQLAERDARIADLRSQGDEMAHELSDVRKLYDNLLFENARLRLRLADRSAP